MKYANVIGTSLALSILLTLVSYFKNNYGACCDQVFGAGWPWPFHGGSGGFIGSTEDKIIFSGLFLDLIFWFGISAGILLAINKIVKRK